VTLYFHSPIRLHGVVLSSEKSTGTIYLHFTFFNHRQPFCLTLDTVICKASSGRDEVVL